MTTSFDYQRELTRCIHCGLCLQACPTYLVDGNEADSPRGRITLMRAVAEGRIDKSRHYRTIRRHLELCLDCRACELECPSGVQYGRLLHETRKSLIGSRLGLRPALTRFVLRQLLPRYGRLRLLTRALWLYQRLGLQRLVRTTGLLRGTLRSIEQLLPPLIWLDGKRPVTFPAKGESRGRVAFFTGCVQDVFFRRVNDTSIELMQRLGFDVDIPPGQTCCGAAHMHAGDENIARRLGRKNINAFLSQDYLAVIGNAGGCTAMLKVAYPSLLEKNPVDRARAAAFSAKVRDINEFVAEHADVCAANRVEARVAYVESCHLRNVLRSSEPIRELMNSIPGLRLAPLSSEHCCGSAGIYNITQAETADRILDLKLQDIVRCQADVVVVNNTGCHLQMLRGVSKSGLNCRVMHSVELLSAAFSDEKPDANRLSPSAARATPSEDRV